MSASYDIFFSYRRHDPVRNVEKQRDVAAPSELFTADVNNLLNDPKIRIVVELMGGIETPLAFIKDAIRARKTVVTGNKALLAEHGQEIFRRAALDVVSEMWTTRASILNRVMGWKELAISKPQQATNRPQQHLAAETRIALLQSHQSQKQTL